MRSVTALAVVALSVASCGHVASTSNVTSLCDVLRDGLADNQEVRFTAFVKSDLHRIVLKHRDCLDSAVSITTDSLSSADAIAFEQAVESARPLVTGKVVAADFSGTFRKAESGLDVVDLRTVSNIREIPKP